MRTYYQTAWTVVGYMRGCDVRCVECALPQWEDQSQASVEDWVESRGLNDPQPHALFASDDTFSLCCDLCGEPIG